jgi:hypothetical protein
MFPQFQVTEVASGSIEIPYKEASLPAMKKELAFNCKPGSLNVIAMSLRYKTSKNSEVNEITDQRWMPAAIIAAHMSIVNSEW